LNEGKNNRQHEVLALHEPLLKWDIVIHLTPLLFGAGGTRRLDTFWRM
jgi:hypothetical protein